jgi:hypothetical protein
LRYAGVLVGIAIERKLIPGVDAPIAPYFPDLLGLSAEPQNRHHAGRLAAGSAGHLRRWQRDADDAATGGIAARSTKAADCSGRILCCSRQ